MEGTKVTKYLLIINTLLLVVFVGLISFWFITTIPDKKASNSTESFPSNQGQSQQPEAPTLTSTTENTTPTITNPVREVDTEYVPVSVPVENILYFGKLYGQEAIFVTNQIHQSYFDEGEELTDSGYGFVVYSDDRKEKTIPFRQFNQEVSIDPGVNRNIHEITSFISDSDSQILYVSILLEPEPPAQYPDLENIILETNLKTSETNVIWRNGLLDSNYPAWGATYLLTSSNATYLSFHKAGCYACGAGQFTDIIVLNTKTGNEIYMEDIGNVVLYPDMTTFTYQVLQNVEIPCEGGPGCNISGYRSEIQPAGPILSEELP